MPAVVQPGSTDEDGVRVRGIGRAPECVGARLRLLVDVDHVVEAMVRDDVKAGRLPVGAPRDADGVGIRRPQAQPADTQMVKGRDDRARGGEGARTGQPVEAVEESRLARVARQIARPPCGPARRRSGGAPTGNASRRAGSRGSRACAAPCPRRRRDRRPRSRAARSGSSRTAAPSGTAPARRSGCRRARARRNARASSSSDWTLAGLRTGSQGSLEIPVGSGRALSRSATYSVGFADRRAAASASPFATSISEGPSCNLGSSRLGAMRPESRVSQT